MQVFDSWAGALSPDYERHVLPRAPDLRGPGRPGVPRIHFGVGTGELLGLMALAGADVVGVDWRVPMATGRQRVPAGVALQGNLEPTWPSAPSTGRAPGPRPARRERRSSRHVFNLGHGVMPAIDPDVLAQVVELVHAEGRDRRDEGPTTDGAREERVVVVGGGITGLATAWWPDRAGVDVTLFEADERLGGKLWTGEVAGEQAELGADAFLARNPAAPRLARRVGLGDDLVSPATGQAWPCRDRRTLASPAHGDRAGRPDRRDRPGPQRGAVARRPRTGRP